MNAVDTIIGGFLLTLFIFLCLKWIAGGFKRSFSDFFIGDDGTYSLSRIQAVAWAYIVISFQITTFFVTLSKPDIHFDLVLPNEILILVTLSLGNYVVVKGVTVNRMVTNGRIAKKQSKRFTDILVGDNGLDFSRFQITIWTIFAIVVYSCSYFHYLSCLIAAGHPTKEEYFMSESTSLPRINPTFLILMGVSHAAYVGKKFIPTYRLNGILSDQNASINDETSILQKQATRLESQIALLDPITTAGKEQKTEMLTQLDGIRDRIQQKDDESTTLKNVKN